MNKQPITFNAAFAYPFSRAKGMLNILWVLLPIVGWFLIGGYGVRIVKEFIKGEFKELPELDFGSDIELGFFMFLKSLPFMLAYYVALGLLSWITGFAVSESTVPSIITLVNTLIALLILPMLFVNFMNKETVGSLFEFKVLQSVINNLGDYLFVALKSIGLGIIFGLLSLVLIGIPAGAFTKNIFFADFYRRRVAK